MNPRKLSLPSSIFIPRTTPDTGKLFVFIPEYTTLHSPKITRPKIDETHIRQPLHLITPPRTDHFVINYPLNIHFKTFLIRSCNVCLKKDAAFAIEDVRH